MSERVFIIGAGQVGRGLAKSFQVAGVPVLGLHSRKPSQFGTSSGAIPGTIGDANVVVIAVRDPQIEGLLGDLSADPSRIASGTVFMHTSGIVDAAGFAELRALDFPCGTFHPLAPFAVPDRAPDLLRGGWIGLDGDDAARAAGRRLAGHLGARTIDIPAGGKTLYHTAAVMASNFPVALASAAGDLLRSLGVPERSANGAVESLMKAAVGNLAEKSPVEALTGPVVRGDPATVKSHLAALTVSPVTAAIYRNLSLVALEMAKKRGTDAKTLQALQRILSGEERKVFHE